MSRSNYSDDCDGWALIRWRGAVCAATKGKRGQKLLRDMADALDAMPQKRLIAHYLEADGEVCALGAVGRAKQIDMTRLDPDEPEDVAGAFGIATALAQEIAYMNDEHGYRQETPEERWMRMRKWVSEQIKATTTPPVSVE